MVAAEAVLDDEDDGAGETVLGASEGDGGASRDRLAGRGEVIDPLLERPLLGEGAEKLECEVTWRNLEGVERVEEPLLGMM